MTMLSCSALQFCDHTSKVLILNSDIDFCQWYLNSYDFNCFSDSEIKALLVEVKPEQYPCIPLRLGSSLDITYLSLELVKLCIE